MDVKNTITEHLTNRGYGAYARETVVGEIADVLQAKIDSAVERLTEYAVEQGLGEHEAKSLLVEVGLAAPVVDEIVEDETPVEGLGQIRTLAESVQALTAQVGALTQFARRHGFA